MSNPRDASEVASAFALISEMTREFERSGDLQTTLERALSTIVRHLGAEAGSLWLVEEMQQGLRCRASVGESPITGVRLPIGEGIVGRCVRENSCITVHDVREHPDFAEQIDQDSGIVTRSLLCAPLTVSEQALGAIELVNKRGGSFEEADEHPLRVLATAAALALANARMAESLVEQERMRRDLDLAAEIQRNLLPSVGDEPFPVFGLNVPASTVSGDFYDFLDMQDGRIAFCVGDVSGKGINAALLMAKTASLYRCVVKSVARPGEVLGRLNAELAETSTRGMFVTMTAGSFDPGNGHVSLANAGHEPTLLHEASGRFRSIPADAPPLGIDRDLVPENGFPEVDLELDGGSLYLFSDGLTEARVASGQQLGSVGVQKLIQRFGERPLRQRVRAVITEIQTLSLKDDATLLGLAEEPR